MSGAAWQICERCGRRCFHYNGLACAACKREDKARDRARAAERERAQAERGRVGDEARRVAALAAFDAESRRIREAAGCARRST